MKKAGKIISISPPNAIPGGEVTIRCENLDIQDAREFRCVIGGKPARLTGIGPTRVIAIVPAGLKAGGSEVRFENGPASSEPYILTVGAVLTDEMHIVANPSVDPADDSIVLTRSGSRGEHLDATLFRLETDGYVHEMRAGIMNPTGTAFGPDGGLYVTNRSDGEVCKIDKNEEVVSMIGGLGVATGIAFDADGVMYVGDRSGTIYKIPEVGRAETFAVLEPSVSAYHLAFGPDGRLYVTAPGLASFDAVHVIDHDGGVSRFFRGFGRPQGLAFDTEGDLYVAACYKGVHGIVRIDSDGGNAETIVAGMNLVGLCFTRDGDMVAATNEAVYSLPLGVFGTLV